MPTHDDRRTVRYSFFGDGQMIMIDGSRPTSVIREPANGVLVELGFASAEPNRCIQRAD